MADHKNLSGLRLHEPFHYVADADPGAVGAGKYWLDTLRAIPVLKRRNLGNTAWVVLTPQDRRWVRSGASHADDDEFNDDDLHADWTRVDAGGGAGRAIWTEEADSLSLYLAGGDAAAEMHALVKPLALSIGESIQCYMKGGGTASNYPFAGLVIADGDTYSAGVQAAMLYFLANGAQYSLSTSNYSNFSSRDSFTDTTSGFFDTGLHMKLEYSATNEFKFYTSPDGISWLLQDTRAITMTPSHVGIMGGSWTSAVPFVFSFDYFRVNV